VWFLLLIALLVIITGMISKRWAITLLIGYTLIIFGETILFRAANTERLYQLTLFWSWKIPELRAQIVANIVLFIPFGIIGARVAGWRIIPVATGLSMMVETIQLIGQRGLFEFDDVIHNTFGAAVGCMMYLLIQAIWRKSHDI